MTAGTRRAVAMVAGSALSGRTPTAVYDQDAGAHFRFAGKVTRGKVSIYDYERGCYLQGQLPALFDHGTGANVRLQLNGDRFEGYDWASSSYFSGRMAGTGISVLDHQTGGFHNYVV